MKRMTLSACAAALVLVASGPAVAQAVAGPALDRLLPPIPQARDVAYPGVITVDVDATDIDRRIVSVRQTIPVAGAGPLILFYPQWIPGNHGPVGPVDDIAGLVITANGQRLAWVRDTGNPWAFHVNVPAGVNQVEAAFQWLTPIDGSQGRVVITQEMLNIQWEKAVLYPAGYDTSGITIKPSLRLPAGWRYGTALETESFENGLAAFRPLSLEHFADSPLFAGLHYRQIDLDPGGHSVVRINMVADEAESLNATDEQIEILRALVDQADYLFGARHFDHYDFLLAATDRLGGIGLEHHRSSENSVDPGFFTQWASKLGDRDLLSHEYVHSWNGKWRRPADHLVPTLNEPLQNSLLWVYEGQTQYWGLILAARSGLLTKQQAMDAWAMWAAQYGAIPGRDWRAMQDTVNDPIIAQRRPQPWASWQRSEDYYVEGALIWLEADALIRNETGGRRSLDDFARAFFGVEDGNWDPKPYTFEELVQTLNGVHAHDWATFLRTRLDAVGPDAPAPLGGIEASGYRLVFTDAPTDYQRALYSEYGRNDFTYSLGFSLGGNNRIGAVRWGSPAFQAGLTAGWEIVAVGERAASPAVLSEAIAAAKGATTPITLVLKNGERFRTVSFDYHDGLRHPRLERVAGTPDRLGEILSPRHR